MEMQITAEQIVKLIERKRDINERLMAQAYNQNDWQTFGSHTQRRDALQELLNEISTSNNHLAVYSGYLDHLATPYQHPDGKETPEWVRQGRPQY